jgi:hypothetical protein
MQRRPPTQPVLRRRLQPLDRWCGLDQAGQPEHVEHTEGQSRRRSDGQAATVAVQQVLGGGQYPNGCGINEGHMGQVDDHVADPVLSAMFDQD